MMISTAAASFLLCARKSNRQPTEKSQHPQTNFTLTVFFHGTVAARGSPPCPPLDIWVEEEAGRAARGGPRGFSPQVGAGEPSSFDQ